MHAEAFVDALVASRIDFISGVPCSFLGSLIAAAASRCDLRYVPATSECEAVGICAGVALAGRRTALLCQNSGLADALNPICSLNVPYRIPLFVIVSARGAPDISDEPHHAALGKSLPDLLELARLVTYELPSVDQLGSVFGDIETVLAERKLAAMVIRKGALVGDSGCTVEPRARVPSAQVPVDLRTGGGLSIASATRHIASGAPARAALISTTGQTTRYLSAVDDSPRCFFMAGAMGCASAIGLGVAIGADRPVVVLDGDGAALMRLGNMATIGWQHPRQFVHVVLDNGCYATTGGQASAGCVADFARIALGCGYAAAFTCDSADGLSRALLEARERTGPVLLHVVISMSDEALPHRPAMQPADIASRFSSFLSSPETNSH